MELIKILVDCSKYFYKSKKQVYGVGWKVLNIMVDK